MCVCVGGVGGAGGGGKRPLLSPGLLIYNQKDSVADN